MTFLHIAAISMLATLAPAAQPEPAKPPAPAAAEPTPVLDEYRRLNDVVGERTPMVLYWDLQSEPGLVLDRRTAAEDAEARAALIQLQPVIAEVIALSRKTPERFVSTAGPDEFDPSPIWLVSRSGRIGIVISDAGRLFDEKDFDAAATRLAAVIRIGAHDLQQPYLPIGTNTAVDTSIRKLLAMVKAGATFGDAARQDLLAALRMVPDTRAAFAATWAATARTSLADAKARYTGRKGLERLREQVDTYGADADALEAHRPQLQATDPSIDALLTPAIVRKPLAPVTPKDVDAAIATAEALIPQVEAALAADDLATAFKPINAAMEADKTQVIRLIIGVPGSGLSMARDLRGEIDAAIKAVEGAR